jgi:hypothetical protein
MLVVLVKQMCMCIVVVVQETWPALVQVTKPQYEGLERF